MKFTIIIATIITIIFFSCNKKVETKNEINKDNYWFQGKAEISSYNVEQYRYGEIHKGKTTLIYVTEDFSKSKQVKLDYPDKTPEDAVKVLKLNALREFQTGLYSYYIMRSVFTPFNIDSNKTLKVIASFQDWCGQGFSQINLDSAKYNLELKSYFESIGDKEVIIDDVLLEDEIWTRIRLNPESLPIGDVDIIPGTLTSRLYLRKYDKLKAFAKKYEDGENSVYSIDYKNLGFKLSITFENEYPYKILSWKEVISKDGKESVTMAVLNKTILTNYWSKNKNEHRDLLNSLK